MSKDDKQMTHPSERVSEAPNIPERKSKYPMLIGITTSGTFAGMMTHECTATIVDQVYGTEGRLVLTDELTYKLPNVHVVYAIVAYITQLRTDLAAANERAERAEKDRDHWKGEYEGWEEREAQVCPEDYGFEEVIDTLRTQLAEAEAKANEYGGLLGRYLAATAGIEELKKLREHVNSRLTPDADASGEGVGNG